jgi:hypothetical protein
LCDQAQGPLVRDLSGLKEQLTKYWSDFPDQKSCAENLKWRGFLRGRIENIEMADVSWCSTAVLLKWPKVFDVLNREPGEQREKKTNSNQVSRAHQGSPRVHLEVVDAQRLAHLAHLNR